MSLELGTFISSLAPIPHFLNMRHWEHAPMPRIALRVGATRQPCRLRLTDGTHTALHRLAPRPRHMRERPRQPTRTRCTVPRSHRHAHALHASAARRHRASCTRSNEYSKASMLQVQSAADARRCQLGCGWCVSARVVARPTLWHDVRRRAVVHAGLRATRAHRACVTLVHSDTMRESAGS